MTDLPPTVANFFLAMQSGAPAESLMTSLFHDDAEYIEPFTGQARRHVGRKAIIEVMKTGWATPLPEMSLSLDRVETAAGEIVVAWTCVSPALPGGKGIGRNRFTLRDGRISRLETTFGH